MPEVTPLRMGDSEYSELTTYFRAPRRNFPDQRSPSTTYDFWGVRENRDLPDVGGDGWGFKQPPPVVPSRLGLVLGVL